MASTHEVVRQRAITRPLGRGIGLAAGAAVISGIAIWLNGFAVQAVPDTALFTTLKNAVAALVLVALAAALVRPGQLRAISRADGVRLTLIGVVGGSVPFVLFFSGLAMASAPAAAFIQKTLFIWVAFLAVPFLGERLGWVQIVALGALLIGQAILIPPQGIHWGVGETLIAAATLLWAVEVVLAKRVLGTVASPIVGAARMAIGLAFLVGYLAISGRLGLLATVSPDAWGWVALTGIVLAAYVTTWYAALERAPATLVSSILVAGAVITGVLGSISRGVAPAPEMAAGYLLIGAAAAVVCLAGLRSPPLAAAA
jgi:drug/metabolite transporter (DMT)-like permease